MPSLIDTRGEEALKLILATLRERASRQENGGQISSQIINRILREKYGWGAPHSLNQYVTKILIKKGILTIVDKSRIRTVYQINPCIPEVPA